MQNDRLDLKVILAKRIVKKHNVSRDICTSLIIFLRFSSIHKVLESLFVLVCVCVNKNPEITENKTFIDSQYQMVIFYSPKALKMLQVWRGWGTRSEGSAKSPGFTFL